MPETVSPLLNGRLTKYHDWFVDQSLQGDELSYLAFRIDHGVFGDLLERDVDSQRKRLLSVLNLAIEPSRVRIGSFRIEKICVGRHSYFGCLWTPSAIDVITQFDRRATQVKADLRVTQAWMAYVITSLAIQEFAFQIAIPSPPGSTPIPFRPSKRESGYFHVSIPQGPVDIVEAADESAAWKAYCEKQGVVGSKHQPVIAPCEPPDQPARAVVHALVLEGDAYSCSASAIDRVLQGSADTEEADPHQLPSDTSQLIDNAWTDWSTVAEWRKVLKGVGIDVGSSHFSRDIKKLGLEVRSLDKSRRCFRVSQLKELGLNVPPCSG